MNLPNTGVGTPSKMPYQELLERLREALGSIESKIEHFIVNVDSLKEEPSSEKTNFEKELEVLTLRAEQIANSIKI